MADRVLKVNDVDVSNKSVSEVVNLLSGKLGTNVKLTLITKDGVKTIEIQREKLDPTKIPTYPRWYQYCGHAKTDNEACFLHYGTKVNKKFEYGYGPLFTATLGNKVALNRYDFEDSLRLCQQSNDKSLCYFQMKSLEFNKNLAQQICSASDGALFY